MRDEHRKEIQKLEAKVEELEERVEIEVETNLEALENSKKWHAMKVFKIEQDKDILIFNQLLTIEKLKKDLNTRDEKITKLTKPKKFRKLRKLANKTKEKINTKVNIVKESIKEKEQKFEAYILQQFETHILKQ